MRHVPGLILLGAVVVAAACAARSTPEPPARPTDGGCAVLKDDCTPPPPVAPEEPVSNRRPPSAPARAQAPSAQAAGGARTPPAEGASPQRAAPQIAALLEAKAARTPAQRKISSDLLTQAASGADGPPPADRLLPADAVVNSVPRYRSIRARLPLAGLEPLAELADVQWIRAADQPRTRTQRRPLAAPSRFDPAAPASSHKVDTSEGDAAHRANVARSTHDVDGTGIGVGVISDGVETLAEQQETGDVPAHVIILPGQAGGAFNLACGGRSNGSEGTAMFEIVHDLAPGAELFFADGGGGSAQMAQNIEDLCTAGADVIVDDIGYLLAPAFQAGVIARAVSAVTARGCYYFSAAGNGGNLHHTTSELWEGDFAAGTALNLSGVGSGAAYHDFGGGVTGNAFRGAAGSLISLQWSDPVDGSANDYDLFLIDADDNVLASSTSTQDGTQEALEYIPGSCGNEYDRARIVIVKNAGAADRYLRLDAGAPLAIATTGRTFGHAASQHAGGRGRGPRSGGGRLRRHGDGRGVQLRRPAADLLRGRRHGDHAGRLLVHRRPLAE